MDKTSQEEETREHPRHASEGLVAAVTVPESPSACHFRVANVSLDGMALVSPCAETSSAIRSDAVLDITVYSRFGVVHCRGFVARVIKQTGEYPYGFGVKVFSFPSGDETVWAGIVEHCANGAGRNP